MDKIDYSIIAEMEKDARKSNTEIADAFGVSNATVRRRINRLIEKGVIKPTVITRASELGYNLVALIALQVDLDSIHDVEQTLMNYDSVKYIADCTGSYDIFMSAWFRSSHDLASFFKDKLAMMTAIKRSETFVIMDVKKDGIGWLQQMEQMHIHSNRHRGESRNKH